MEGTGQGQFSRSQAGEEKWLPRMGFFFFIRTRGFELTKGWHTDNTKKLFFCSLISAFSSWKILEEGERELSSPSFPSFPFPNFDLTFFGGGVVGVSFRFLVFDFPSFICLRRASEGWKFGKCVLDQTVWEIWTRWWCSSPTRMSSSFSSSFVIRLASLFVSVEFLKLRFLVRLLLHCRLCYFGTTRGGLLSFPFSCWLLVIMLLDPSLFGYSWNTKLISEWNRAESFPSLRLTSKRTIVNCASYAPLLCNDIRIS